MTGNGEWSYTLSNEKGTNAPINISTKQMVVKDSIHFEGRTPCRQLSELALHFSDDATN